MKIKLGAFTLYASQTKFIKKMAKVAGTVLTIRCLMKLKRDVLCQNVMNQKFSMIINADSVLPAQATCLQTPMICHLPMLNVSNVKSLAVAIAAWTTKSVTIT